MITWKTLEKAWNTYYLESLTHRFFKFTLQLIHKYYKYMDKLQTNNGATSSSSKTPLQGGMSLSDMAYACYDLRLLEKAISNATFLKKGKICTICIAQKICYYYLGLV